MNESRVFVDSFEDYHEVEALVDVLNHLRHKKVLDGPEWYGDELGFDGAYYWGLFYPVGAEIPKETIKKLLKEAGARIGELKL